MDAEFTVGENLILTCIVPHVSDVCFRKSHVIWRQVDALCFGFLFRAHLGVLGTVFDAGRIHSTDSG